MKRPVICRKCNWQFDSTVEKPICSKCRSSKVSNIEDIPRIYGGIALQNLRKEFEEFKEAATLIINKHTHKIKELEGKL